MPTISTTTEIYLSLIADYAAKIWPFGQRLSASRALRLPLGQLIAILRLSADLNLSFEYELNDYSSPWP
jgi:hypothetical protein